MFKEWFKVFVTNLSEEVFGKVFGVESSGESGENKPGQVSESGCFRNKRTGQVRIGSSMVA